ncbi:MAG: hypothetical protein ACXWUG_26975 [Polyangiales bacterium]
MRRWVSLLAFATVVSASCAVGQGTGSVTGHLHVDNCEADLSNYDMQPDFFGAIAANDQLLIRIQKGGDLQEYQDSVVIAIDDTKKVIDGQPIQLELERPPGSLPSVPAPLARMTLSLRNTCGDDRFGNTDNAQVLLHAVKGTITFTSILRGDPSSSDTNSKRIEGTFEADMEDPRHPPGSEPKQVGHLSGSFKFFYQRGGPAQPFP